MTVRWNRRGFANGVILGTLVLLGRVTSVEAQFGPGPQNQEPPKNLQVFPKDTKRQDLIQKMRGFTDALGVRCVFCHVSDAAKPDEVSDFSLDTKENKKVARTMIKMTAAINTTFLPELGRKSVQEVRCMTCHHGSSEPRQLAETLMAALEKNGVNAAVERYKALRTQYYGRAVYDFGESSLLGVAETLGRRPNGSGADASLAFLKLNLEYYPDSAFTHMRLGQTYLAAKDTVSAVKSLEKAFSLQPNNTRLQDQLKALKK